MGTFVQYGCGLSNPESWHNFDASPRLRIENLPIINFLMRSSGKKLFPDNVKYGDIIKGLPYSPGEVDNIYCSHVLEHLDRKSIKLALDNTFKILKPNGVFRLIVPDLSWRVDEYVRLRDKGQVDAADKLMRSCLLGQEKQKKGIEARVRAMFGNAEHLWMYDENAMRELLMQAGFVNIRRCDFGDSADAVFSTVENRDRFYENNGERELAIEAHKPLD